MHTIIFLISNQRHKIKNEEKLHFDKKVRFPCLMIRKQREMHSFKIFHHTIMEPPSFQNKKGNNSRNRSKNSDSTPNNSSSQNFNTNNSFQNTSQLQNNNFTPNNTFTPTTNFQPQNDTNNSNFYQPMQSTAPAQKTQQPDFMIPGGTDMAMGMATNFANQYGDKGKEMMDKYIDAKSLKLYFQVDTNYVLKKLQLLLVPYIHKEWSVQNMGANAQPRSPKEDLNMPDLYIPFMGLLTYVLLVGIKVGQGGDFNPDQLGASLSTGLGWIIFEVLVVSFVMYLISLRTDMKTYWWV